VARTRKPGVVWLPNDGGNTLLAGTTVFKDFILNVDGAGNDINVVIPLTVDFPAEPADTLSDYAGSGYRLRRIVGKIFAAVEQDAEPDVTSPSAVIVTCGFIVLRVNAPGVPLSGANGLDYSPQLLDSERDPWIWRRSWILGNHAVAPGGSGQIVNSYPRNTAEYSSVADGPHIDAKTARAVKDEERLFFAAGGVGINGSGQGVGTNVRFTLDYRLLASMYKQSGNRRNASR